MCQGWNTTFQHPLLKGNALCLQRLIAHSPSKRKQFFDSLQHEYVWKNFDFFSLDYQPNKITLEKHHLLFSSLVFIQPTSLRRSSMTICRSGGLNFCSKASLRRSAPSTVSRWLLSFRQRDDASMPSMSSEQKGTGLTIITIGL